MPVGDAATADDTAMQDTEAPLAYSTRITSPVDQSTIPMGPGDFAVEAAVQPRLRIGEHLDSDTGRRIGWRTPTSRPLATDQRVPGRTSAAGFPIGCG